MSEDQTTRIQKYSNCHEWAHLIFLRNWFHQSRTCDNQTRNKHVTSCTLHGFQFKSTKFEQRGISPSPPTEEAGLGTETLHICCYLNYPQHIQAQKKKHSPSMTITPFWTFLDWTKYYNEDIHRPINI